MTGEYRTPGPIDAPDEARVISRWDDSLERDGEMLVMVGDDVTLLGELAAEAARLALPGITIGALQGRLLRQFGLPADKDPGAAVREVVAALVERGVMRLE